MRSVYLMKFMGQSRWPSFMQVYIILYTCFSLASVFYSSARKCKCDIWKMKTYRDKESWVKEYVIDQPILNILLFYDS